MQAAREDLAPPKDDPYTTEQLKQYNGSDPTKPIFVAIKGSYYLIFFLSSINGLSISIGTIFDVSAKADVYGLGKSYNIFAGKDGSKGLGLSSLKEEDAVADYSGLDEKDRKVLDDWHSFFSYVQLLLSLTMFRRAEHL
jgi:membrane-associated progesterone receptor component